MAGTFPPQRRRTVLYKKDSTQDQIPIPKLESLENSANGRLHLALSPCSHALVVVVVIYRATACKYAK